MLYLCILVQVYSGKILVINLIYRNQNLVRVKEEKYPNCQGIINFHWCEIYSAIDIQGAIILYVETFSSSRPDEFFPTPGGPSLLRTQYTLARQWGPHVFSSAACSLWQNKELWPIQCYLHWKMVAITRGPKQWKTENIQYTYINVNVMFQASGHYSSKCCIDIFLQNLASKVRKAYLLRLCFSSVYELKLQYITI